MSKTEALDQIAALATEHDISLDEIAIRLGATGAKSPARQSSILKQLLGYTGGIFVFSGICLLFGMIWDDIASLQRVLVSLGSGLVAFILGSLFVRDARFEKAATPMFLVAALLQPSGLFIFLHEYMPEGGDAKLAAMMVFFTIAAQQALAFWSLRRTSLLFLAYCFWTMAITTALSWLDFDGSIAALIVGTSLLCLSWAADKSAHRAITPFWYFWGGAFVLGGFWDLVKETPLDLAYLGLNSFMIFLSIRVASRSLLFVSVLGLLCYLSYFTAEYFADVIGWPIALIVMGLIMIGLSAFALRLGRKIKSS